MRRDGGRRAREVASDAGRRGGRTTRAFGSLLRFGASCVRASGVSALVEVATVGDMAIRCMKEDSLAKGVAWVW